MTIFNIFIILVDGLSSDMEHSPGCAQGREQQNLDIKEENSIMYLIEYILKYSN